MMLVVFKNRVAACTCGKSCIYICVVYAFLFCTCTSLHRSLRYEVFAILNYIAPLFRKGLKQSRFQICIDYSSWGLLAISVRHVVYQTFEVGRSTRSPAPQSLTEFWQVFLRMCVSQT
jgi:hypothetical protein